jgi:hypothetical protein
VKDSPVDEYKVLVNNHDLFVSNKGNSCCEFKEWLKLYSYATTEYPLVDTLDLDTIVLKPMDELFDHMIRSSSYKQAPFVHAMWKDTEAKYNQRVDFAFTRDTYVSSNPIYHKQHIVPINGGFLVVRRDFSVFDKMVRIITEGGDFVHRTGWGGKVLPRYDSFGRYYGEGTVQGFYHTTIIILMIPTVH